MKFKVGTGNAVSIQLSEHDLDALRAPRPYTVLNHKRQLEQHLGRDYLLGFEQGLMARLSYVPEAFRNEVVIPTKTRPGLLELVLDEAGMESLRETGKLIMNYGSSRVRIETDAYITKETSEWKIAA